MVRVRRFDAAFSESFSLDDGTRIVFRTLAPGDAPLLLGHFAALSAETRRRRFLSAKATLTAADLRHLTELDGEMRFAVTAALSERPHELAAVARFVRQPLSPDVAEPAVSVIDRMHGRGLGAAIVARLVEAAVERGVRRFRWEMLSDNVPVQQLARSLGARIVVLERGAVARVEAWLPSAPWRTPPTKT